MTDIKKATPAEEREFKRMEEKVKQPVNPHRTAHEILSQISGLIEERGKTYDKGEERSFTKVAHAYNSIKGSGLSGSDIALMLVILKLVRQETSDTVHRDSIDDLVAYSALYGEELEKKK